MNQFPRIGDSPILHPVSIPQNDQKISLFNSTLPVVDLNHFKSYDPKIRQKFVDELAKALKEVGFVAVLNPGVDEKALDEGYLAIEQFFKLSMKEKMALNSPHLGGQRGYSKGESAKGEKTGDFKEFFHVGSDQSNLPNVWPETIDLDNPLTRVFKELQKHAFPLQQAMAAAIGESEDFFTNMTEKGELLLRALHYPKNPPENRPWAAPHTDIDLFTILPKATEKGLQLKDKEGNWIDVIVPEGSFIINAGDMLANLTNGEFKSCEHRVVAEKGKERFSMVLFIHPKSEDKCDPLPQCIIRTGGSAKFPTATRWELLLERLVDLDLASEEHVKELSKSGLIDRTLAIGKAVSSKVIKKIIQSGCASEVVKKEWEKFNN